VSSDILRNTQEHMHVWTYFDVRFDSSKSVTVRGLRCTEVRLHCDTVMNGTVERRYGTESLSPLLNQISGEVFVVWVM
jgi:hypothetical protein